MEQTTKVERLGIYKYLVDLRNSGITNMWGASIYLEDEFDLSEQEAKTALTDWIKTFDLPEDRQPQDGRHVQGEGTEI